MASWLLVLRRSVSFTQVSSSKFLDNFCTDPRFFWFFCGAKKGKAPQKNRAAGKRPLTLAVELHDPIVRAAVRKRTGNWRRASGQYRAAPALNESAGSPQGGRLDHDPGGRFLENSERIENPLLRSPGADCDIELRSAHATIEVGRKLWSPVVRCPLSVARPDPSRGARRSTTTWPACPPLAVAASAGLPLRGAGSGNAANPATCCRTAGLRPGRASFRRKSLART
jgi:hypothetical protein